MYPYMDSTRCYQVYPGHRVIACAAACVASFLHLRRCGTTFARKLSHTFMASGVILSFYKNGALPLPSDPYPLPTLSTPHALARVGGAPYLLQSPPMPCEGVGGRELLRRPRTRHYSHTIVASIRDRSRSTNLSI